MWLKQIMVVRFANDKAEGNTMHMVTMSVAHLNH